MLLYHKNGVKFYYRHIVKKGLKHIYIKIEKNGEVLLKSSPYKKRDAIEFLEKKSLWIDKNLQNILKKGSRSNIYKDGGEVFYLGKSYPLVYQKSDRRGERVVFKEDGFTFLYSDKKEPQKAVERFYRLAAKEIFEKRVEHFSQKMGLYPKVIKFRKAKRRLGSCRYDNVLSFNYLAVKLSLEEIDYIVVHELAHIKEKNHSKKFWSIVEKEFPNYKEIRSGITLAL